MRCGIALALLLTTAATPLSAQGRIARKWLLAGVGVLFSGAMAGVYAAVHQRDDLGGCGNVKCVVPVTIAGGALIGYMIGSEMDHLYALRYAHAPPLNLRGVELPLSVVPTDASLSQHTVLVSGEDAVELIHAGPSLKPLGLRARGLREIGPVAADSVANTLLVGTPTGLYSFPLRGDRPGTLARSGEISAVSTDHAFAAVGLGDAFQIVRLTDSVRAAGDTVPEESRVVDLTWQNDSTLWVLTEDHLLTYRVDAEGANTPLGDFELPGTGRRISLNDSLAIVALGSVGVSVLDIRDPSQVTPVASWSGARYTYDAAAVGDRVYVAAGPEGLYELQLVNGALKPLGLARGTGFVASVDADGGSVYLLDRSGGLIRRIPVVDTK